MNYPAASGRSINPKKQNQDTPQAAGELTQKRLKQLKPKEQSFPENVQKLYLIKSYFKKSDPFKYRKSDSICNVSSTS
jgi:hypothetical protein